MSHDDDDGWWQLEKRQSADRLHKTMSIAIVRLSMFIFHYLPGIIYTFTAFRGYFSLLICSVISRAIWHICRTARHLYVGTPENLPVSA